MKKIGDILKQSRIDKNFSLKELENKTKIKSSFIIYIENGDWDNLPPFPTVLGFVKSLASSLSIDESMAASLLKRDYPPKKLNILPKPDVVTKTVLGPKLTFSIGVVLIFLILLSYLGFQYYRFVSPPVIKLDSPKQNQIITTGDVNVFGSTDTDVKITVNNQPVEVSSDGKFNVSLDVVADTHEIVVTASSRSGKITTVSRKIEVKPN